MSEGLFEWIRCLFILEIIVAAYIIILPLKKQKKFALWFTGLSGMFCIFAGFIPIGVEKYIIETILLCVVIFKSCKITWRKAVYCTLCAYALQHLCYAAGMSGQYLFGMLTHIPYAVVNSGPDILVWKFWIVHLLVYGGYYVIFIRKREKEEEYDIGSGTVVGFAAGVFLVVLVLSMLVQNYQKEADYGVVLLYYICSMLCCVFIIVMDEGIYQRIVTQSELGVIQYLWEQRQDQYFIAKENISAINRKCHELKKQISQIQEREMPGELMQNLEELKNSIQIYDAVVKTGNEVLDIVTTEKSLYCQAQKITLLCVLDGEVISFMEPTDIYFLFGNMLDSAIQETLIQKGDVRRQIAFSVWRQNGLLMIQLENYYGQTELDESVEEYDSRKYGTKGINYIIEKYQGCMTMHEEHEMRIRRIAVPVPETD